MKKNKLEINNDCVLFLKGLGKLEGFPLRGGYLTKLDEPAIIVGTLSPLFSFSF